MELPHNLHHKRFVEWNEIVQGLMESWEWAQRCGLERRLERRLSQDHDGSLTDYFSRIGNEMRRIRLEREREIGWLPDAELMLRTALTRDAGQARETEVIHA
jgi:hypothetical protein